MDRFIIYEKPISSTGFNSFVYDVLYDNIFLPLTSHNDIVIAREEKVRVFVDNWRVFSPIAWLAKRYPDVNFKAVETKIRKNIGPPGLLEKISMRLKASLRKGKICPGCPHQK